MKNKKHEKRNWISLTYAIRTIYIKVIIDNMQELNVEVKKWQSWNSFFFKNNPMQQASTKGVQD